jgi:hypothetical protein
LENGRTLRWAHLSAGLGRGGRPAHLRWECLASSVLLLNLLLLNLLLNLLLLNLLW